VHHVTAYDEGKYILEVLEVSFDCSWSYVREAPQASGEIIYNGDYNNNSSCQMEHAILRKSHEEI